MVLLWQRLCSVIHTGSACARKPSSPPRECTLVSSCTVERKVGETVHTTSCILFQASLEFTYGMMIYNFFTLTWDSLMWSKQIWPQSWFMENYCCTIEYLLIRLILCWRKKKQKFTYLQIKVVDLFSYPWNDMTDTCIINSHRFVLKRCENIKETLKFHFISFWFQQLTSRLETFCLLAPCLRVPSCAAWRRKWETEARSPGPLGIMPPSSPTTQTPRSRGWSCPQGPRNSSPLPTGPWSVGIASVPD